MSTLLRRIGNSFGVIIPKPLLEQAGLVDEVDLVLERGAIVLRAPAKSARRGWAAASKRIAAADDDALVMPEFANEEDTALTW